LKFKYLNLKNRQFELIIEWKRLLKVRKKALLLHLSIEEENEDKKKLPLKMKKIHN